MAHTTLPRKDADLVAWGDNFVSFVQTGFATYGLTSAQSALFVSAQTAWKNAWTEATNSATRTKPKVAAKNDQRKLFRKQAMQTVSIVRGFAGITNELLEDLKIDVRPSGNRPTPQPNQMLVTVAGVERNLVNVQLSAVGATGSTRRRPPGTKGATLVYFVGATPPPDPALWSFAGNTTLTKFTFELPAGTPAGTLVWVSGFWFNNRAESGMAATPVSANLGFSGVEATPMQLKQAA